MMEEKRIIAEKLGKKFKIGFVKSQGALARLVALLSGREARRTIWALNGVSLIVNQGEIVGVIGKNGSGKSTLLRCISKIYKADAGKIKTKGKIISLIGLDIGMQHRLTMKDNIFLCCSLFGLSKQEIKKRFQDIVKFSELQDFVNTKLYQFSEGMKQRLAFSIAISCSPEILLLDEVFEVGDENFKEKSARKIKELVKKGVSVMLVSHDLNIIEKHCDRVILLAKGSIKKEGKIRKVLRAYENK